MQFGDQLFCEPNLLIKNHLVKTLERFVFTTIFG